MSGPSNQKPEARGQMADARAQDSVEDSGVWESSQALAGPGRVLAGLMHQLIVQIGVVTGLRAGAWLLGTASTGTSEHFAAWFWCKKFGDYL